MNKETTEQGRGYQSPYPSEITYKSDKGFLVRLKAMIERIMRDANYKTYGEGFDNFISRFDDAEDYLFESRESAPSPVVHESGMQELVDIMSKFGEAHNMLAKTKLTRDEYQPISTLLAEAKIELYNFYKGFPSPANTSEQEVDPIELGEHLWNAGVSSGQIDKVMIMLFQDYKISKRIQPQPPKEKTDLDLLELVCQLHSRASANYNNKEMHDAYVEARKEIESRLAGYAASSSEGDAIEVLDWLLEHEVTTHAGGSDNIIICDGDYYWESDKDGDQPMAGKDIFELYKKSKVVQPKQ